jgi:GNAT superfamily N-acetyltransferase
MQSNDAPCQFLEWDSDFFGFRVARATVNRLDAQTTEAMLAWCEEQGITCLYFLANADDPPTIRQAEDHGFRMVEVRLTFERRLKGWDPKTRPKAAEDVHIRPVQPEDIPTLQELATNSYINTRFYFDDRFPERKCQQLYQAWVRRSCEGAAQMALVAEADDRILGFITGYRDQDEPRGQFDLTAVRHEVRRAGIGHELFRSGLDWYVRSGVEYIWLVTQGRNIPTQRMVLRHDFLPRDCQLYYHKWFSDR